MKRIKQINYLTIKYDDKPEMVYFGKKQKNPTYDTYSVWHGKVCLEDRLTYVQAVDFCKNTKDYCIRKGEE